MPRMVLKITNLHILRYLPTCWLYLLERYAIDNQRCTHTASGNNYHKTATDNLHFFTIKQEILISILINN